MQYADFAKWQRAWVQGPLLEEQLGYWKKQLRSAPALLELPADRPRPSLQSFRGACESRALPKKLGGDLEQLSRREGVTLYMTLLAAFQTLLVRYTGQEDICVGSPVANRNRTEIENLIGFFANTLILRTRFNGNPTFRDLLSRVREVALGAYAHQDVPFEKLVEELQPERNLSHNPLFQVMLVLYETPTQTLEASGLTLRMGEAESTTSKFDLTLYVIETADGLNTRMEYNTDLFSGSTIRRMLGHFQTLLEGVVREVDAKIQEVPLLTQEEKQQFLEWNATEKSYPEITLHKMFEEQVKRSPEATALVFRILRVWSWWWIPAQNRIPTKFETQEI